MLAHTLYATCFLYSLLICHALLQVTGSRQYIEYHQKKFGYKEPNVSFVQGYMEKLGEAGIQKDTMDVVL